MFALISVCGCAWKLSLHQDSHRHRRPAAKDPDGIKKDFVPKSDKVLHATKVIDANSGTVLRFQAPEKPGVYPFVCTFPGHWVIMNGKMIVK
jgi:azurin